MSAALALRIDRAVVVRGILAGTAWGLVLSAGFVGIALTQCGLPCPDDVAFTTIMSVATGIVTIGPLAAFAKRPNV